MLIENMHYDFKKKFNKIDSNQNRNLLIPEIDWALNEAQKIFIDIIARPRGNTYLGFERTKKNIDDIKALVITYQSFSVSKNEDKYILTLPENYLYYISSYSIISKGNCKNKIAKNYIQKHSELFSFSPFDVSSFLWREITILLDSKGIVAFTDGTFNIDNICLSYIRKPAYMHNAKDFKNGSYKLASGEILTGKQDCEIPECANEIVDLAVAIASGEIQSNYYQMAYSKLGLNNLK